MFKKAKAKLLTRLFMEWVSTEKDVESLMLTRTLIDKRKRISSCAAAFIFFSPSLGLNGTQHLVPDRHDDTTYCLRKKKEQNINPASTVYRTVYGIVYGMVFIRSTFLAFRPCAPTPGRWLSTQRPL